MGGNYFQLGVTVDLAILVHICLLDWLFQHHVLLMIGQQAVIFERAKFYQALEEYALPVIFQSRISQSNYVK